MKNKIILIIINFTFLFTILVAQKVNEYEYLKKYAGEYANKEVLGDSKINPILRNMMGNEYDHLISNLDVTGPLDLINGSVVISGNARHRGGEEMAIIDITLYTGIIRAAIASHGKIIIYSDKMKYDKYIDKDNYAQLPSSILNFITSCNSNRMNIMKKPNNVIIK
jgi:hypothetical protein